jgi:hypothetical protein
MARQKDIRISVRLDTVVTRGDDSHEGASQELQASLAYVGMNNAIAKSLDLSFDGFNNAGSSTIPPQSATGDKSGILTITGEVDQGASSTKGMRLRMSMIDYSDGTATLPDDEGKAAIAYRTSDATLAPALVLTLRNIPNGTYSGTFVGSIVMLGDVEATVSLNLSLSGQFEDDGTGKLRRKAGTTAITGTAAVGVYTVNVVI